MFAKYGSSVAKCIFFSIGALLATYTIAQVWFVSHWKVDVMGVLVKDDEVRMSETGERLGVEVLQREQDMHVGKLPVATTKQHVLINSYMSCGSRFTGQFFGFRNDSFYFYEPLWSFNVMGFYDEPNLECDIAGTKTCRTITGAQLNTMSSKTPLLGTKSTQAGKLYQKDVSNSSVTDILVDVLTDIYQCRFDRLLNVVVNNVHAEESWAGPSWKVYRDCVKEKTQSKLQCLKRLENVCKMADHVVTKVLRITTRSLDKLMERVINLKVLHLYRDPRAIINSRREWKGYPITTGLDTANKLCDKMMVDLEGGVQMIQNFPDRFKFVFYEDLTSDVEYKTKELYKFLGMDPSIVTFEHADTLEKIVNVAPKDSKAAKLEELRKNNNAFWWRKNLPYNVYGITQAQCLKVASIFNLTNYKNESTLRDMDIPSMNLPKLFVIL